MLYSINGKIFYKLEKKMKRISTDYPEFIKKFPLCQIPDGSGGQPFLDSEDGQVVFHTIAAGQSVPLHRHDDSWAILVRGLMEVIMDHERFTVIPGESWFIPASVEHGGKAIKDCLLVEVFCEKRFSSA